MNSHDNILSKIMAFMTSTKYNELNKLNLSFKMLPYKQCISIENILCFSLVFYYSTKFQNWLSRLMAINRNLAIEYMLKQILVPLILIISGNIYKDYSKCYNFQSLLLVDLIHLVNTCTQTSVIDIT